MKFHLEIDLEAGVLSHTPMLAAAIQFAIENTFFTDVKITQLIVRRDDIPTERIQTNSDAFKSTT